MHPPHQNINKRPKKYNGQNKAHNAVLQHPSTASKQECAENINDDDDDDNLFSVYAPFVRTPCLCISSPCHDMGSMGNRSSITEEAIIFTTRTMTTTTITVTTRTTTTSSHPNEHEKFLHMQAVDSRFHPRRLRPLA